MLPTTVQAKNSALKEAGAVVPESFEDFEGAIKATYNKMVKEGSLKPQPDIPAPSVPQDLIAAQKAGKVRAAGKPQSWPPKQHSPLGIKPSPPLCRLIPAGHMPS